MDKKLAKPVIHGTKVYRENYYTRYGSNKKEYYWRCYNIETDNPLHHGNFSTLEDAIKQMEA